MKNNIKNLIDTLVMGAGEMGQDVLAIRCYNSWTITEDMVKECIDDDDDVRVFFHEFTPDKMADAYEPFLDWIKEIYMDSDSRTPEEFMEKCNVYPIHQKMFSEYIKNGICVRTEPVIVPEIAYDRQRIMDSIINIVNYGTKEKRILFVLGNLHYAGYSTVNFIRKIINDRNESKLAFLCAFDEIYGVPVYMNEVWSDFIQKLEEKNLIVAMSDKDVRGNSQNEMNYFTVDFKDSKIYIDKLNTMIKTLAIRQARYYLEMIYQKLKLENCTVDKDTRVIFFEMYARACLYAHQYENSLIICDNIMNLCGEDTGIIAFRCESIVCLAQLYMGQSSVAHMTARKCMREAVNLEDNYLIFQSKVLEAVVMLKGFVDWIFIRDDAKEWINEEFTKEVEKYGWLNHLSYIYIYAFEQSKSFYQGKNATDKLVYFNKGAEIIRKNGNYKFLVDAYKKCAMYSSVAGNVEEVDRNYKKCIEILRGLDEKAEEVDIYNGMGYNRMMREGFEKANEYYNKALAISNELNDPEMVSETFYNMCNNAIMSDDFRNGCIFIDAAIQLLDNAHVYKPRICNRAKLYGMAALCYFKMGNIYKTKMYYDQNKRILRHLLEPDEGVEPNYEMWDDEAFYHFYVYGNMLEAEDENEKAIDMYKEAKSHMLRSDGIQVVSWTHVALDMARVYKKLGLEKERMEVLEEALEFCEKHKLHYSIRKLQAEMDDEEFEYPDFNLELGVNINQILIVSERIGTEKELHSNGKNLDFLSNWQEQLAIEGLTEEQMMDKSMTTLRSSFGLDRILLFNVKDDKYTIKYCDEEIDIDNEKLDIIAKFFRVRKNSFVVSRTDSKFDEYREIIDCFGVNDVVSMIAIPIFNNEELETILITYQNMHENFHSTKVMLTESDLKVFIFALRQLINEIYRMYAREQIHDMNRELKEKNQLLENLAHTDNLTGLLNRQGFNKIVDEKIDITKVNDNIETYITVMYIDLDNFKYCNDTFGHDIGDFVLKTFSKLFTDIIGKSGYVVRYGGDEFVIVVENINRYYGEEVAEAIFEELKEDDSFKNLIEEKLGRQVDIPDKSKLSCSIGIAVKQSGKVETISELLKHADEALYDVKKSSKHDYKIWS